MSSEYPEQRLLWPGAILGSIAHALFVARHPDFAHEQSWDGLNYSVQDSAGSRGTVTFAANGHFVAVFFSEDSDRNPFSLRTVYSLQKRLVGLPDDLKALAHKEALQYVLQGYNNTTIPIVTSIFWGDGKQRVVGAAEAWSDVLKHGAFLVKDQLLEYDASLDAWAAQYGFSESESAFVASLFRRKLSTMDKQLVLTADDRRFVSSYARDAKAVDVSRESFSEVDILL